MRTTSAILAGLLVLFASTAVARDYWIMSAPQPSPGDPQMPYGQMSSAETGWQYQSVPSSPPMAVLGRGSSQTYITDEYGRRYNERGERLDGAGNVIAPFVGY
jgi:hypothetical protein